MDHKNVTWVQVTNIQALFGWDDGRAMIEKICVFYRVYLVQRPEEWKYGDYIIIMSLYKSEGIEK